MRIEQFIAGRLVGSTGGRSFTSVIIGIAITSVALSVSVMIVASSVIHGFKKEISQKIFDFWGHIQITDAFASPIIESTPIQFDQALVDSLTSVGQITYEWPWWFFGRETRRTRHLKTKGGIKKAYKYIQYPAVLTTKDDMEGLVLKGVADDFPGDFFAEYVDAGTGLSLDAEDPGRDLVISQMTAERMLLAVGDRVRLHFVIEGNLKPRAFTVKGIYNTGLAEYDKKVAFLDLRIVQDVLDWSEDQVSGIEVLLDDIDDLHILDAYIYHEILPADQYTRTIRQRAGSTFDWLDLQNINEIIILALMLVVCVINMITALLILILERTQMIGVLKALGSNNWQIRRIFIRQAAHVLVKGLVLGNLIGVSLCLLQRKFEFVKLREEEYYLAVAPIDFHLGVIVLINVGTVLVTVLFLILPSYFISRISPTQAIRFN